PNVSKIEILRRSKVRRNFLSFLRERRGKSARLREISFDKAAANDVSVPEEPEVIEEAQAEDALNDAESLNVVENAENREAAAEDEVAPGEDVDESSEQEAAVAETEQGLERAEPGEGEAVKS
ncbi:MAG TPA: 50S ribosomal protein L19, partial [Candidatus Saccharimonadia bacterium]|nr:50S ribosomal protein L19 [Candidatus Saccharimonadia bacterium]